LKRGREGRTLDDILELIQPEEDEE
jgi:hypothetical protein